MPPTEKSVFVDKLTYGLSMVDEADRIGKSWGTNRSPEEESAVGGCWMNLLTSISCGVLYCASSVTRLGGVVRVSCPPDETCKDWTPAFYGSGSSHLRCGETDQNKKSCNPFYDRTNVTGKVAYSVLIALAVPGMI